MIIKNKDLNKMLQEHGRHYTLTMYINNIINLTKKQFEYVFEYKDDKNEKKRKMEARHNV